MRRIRKVFATLKEYYPEQNPFLSPNLQRRTREEREATGATVEAIHDALHLYLEAAFRNYCEQISKGNGAQMPKPALTSTELAKMVKKTKSYISRLLEIRTPLDRCAHKEIHIQWEAAHDLHLMVEYGKKYWGRKYRGW